MVLITCLIGIPTEFVINYLLETGGTDLSSSPWRGQTFFDRLKVWYASKTSATATDAERLLLTRVRNSELRTDRFGAINSTATAKHTYCRPWALALVLGYFHRLSRPIEPSSSEGKAKAPPSSTEGKAKAPPSSAEALNAPRTSKLQGLQRNSSVQPFFDRAPMWRRWLGQVAFIDTSQRIFIDFHGCSWMFMDMYMWILIGGYRYLPAVGQALVFVVWAICGILVMAY